GVLRWLRCLPRSASPCRLPGARARTAGPAASPGPARRERSGWGRRRRRRPLRGYGRVSLVRCLAGLVGRKRGNSHSSSSAGTFLCRVYPNAVTGRWIEAKLRGMSEDSSALLTDHYELTMLQGALHSGAAARRSVFEMFARRLPEGRRYG